MAIVILHEWQNVNCKSPDIRKSERRDTTGYLLKDAPRQELFRAVRAAAKGESALAPAVASRLLGRMRAPAEEQLSEQEVEVLQLVAKGNSNRLVGRALHISEGDGQDPSGAYLRQAGRIRPHLRGHSRLPGSGQGKLRSGVSDRTSAVTVALERGILRLD